MTRALEYNGIPARTLAALVDYPVGVHCATLAARFECRDKPVTEALRKLKSRGMAVSLPDPVGKSNNRPRWCLPQHLETMRTDIERSKVPTKKAAALAPARMVGDAIVTPRTKITTGQNFLARPRHYVEKPEPFFSAMSPGSYPPHDSAIARAYGGGR